MEINQRGFILHGEFVNHLGDMEKHGFAKEGVDYYCEMSRKLHCANPFVNCYYRYFGASLNLSALE